MGQLSNGLGPIDDTVLHAALEPLYKCSLNKNIVLKIPNPYPASCSFALINESWQKLYQQRSNDWAVYCTVRISEMKL